ncbi:MAG: hypothetical protein ACRCU1_15210 [Alsobacter sp.]
MPARNARGQFVKGGGRKRSGGSRAIVRSSGGGAIRTRTRTVTVAAPRRRSAAASSGGGGARVRPKIGLAAAALGLLNRKYGAQTIQRLPKIKGSHIITLGAGLHFLKPKSGSALDHIATAAVAVGAYEVTNNSDLLGADDDASW